MADGEKCNNVNCKTIVTEIRKKDGQYKKYCSLSCRRLGVAEKAKQTSLERYGVSNPSKSKEIKQRIKDSFTEKYGEGITNSMDLKEFRDKIKETNIERYGTDKPQSLEQFQKKTRESNLEKFGTEIPQLLKELKNKTIETNIEKYGVAHSSKLKITQDKKVGTNLEKYGVTNVMHASNIFDKNRYFQKRDYIFESGRIEKIQGYEGKGIDLLLNTYHEDDIIINPSQLIKVFYLEDNRNHRYFPDIFVPKDNLVVEIKSEYTYKGFIGWYNTNLLKRQACLDAGYNFKFMIFDKDGNLISDK
jgi:hypothetical protein